MQQSTKGTAVPVAIFDPAAYGLTETRDRTKHEWFETMGAKTTISKGEKKGMKASEELEEEKSMKEILERLESLEELNESAMDGRARRNNYHARLVALGAKAPKNIKTPSRMLKGMRAKHKLQETKARELAREQGFIATSAQAIASARSDHKKVKFLHHPIPVERPPKVSFKRRQLEKQTPKDDSRHASFRRNK